MSIIKTEWTNVVNNSPRISDFLRQVDKDFYPSLSSRVDIDQYARKLADKACNLFAVEDGIDVGSCSVYCNRDEAFITSIAVKREYRNRGVGNILMESVKEYVEKKGISGIRLQVFKENEGAIRYYIKNGFTQLSEDENWIDMICKIK